MGIHDTRGEIVLMWAVSSALIFLAIAHSEDEGQRTRMPDLGESATDLDIAAAELRVRTRGIVINGFVSPNRRGAALVSSVPAVTAARSPDRRYKMRPTALVPYNGFDGRLGDANMTV